MQKFLIIFVSFIIFQAEITISTAQIAIQTNLQDSFLTNGVIAHRGAWKQHNLPQNSIASLKKAIEIGAAGSEFDVWLTADGILVLNHDSVYEGMVIEKTNYAKLKKKPLKNGEVLPTLENILKTGMTQQKTRLILELKPSAVSQERSLLAAQETVKLVRRLNAQKWIVYISFNYGILQEIHRLDRSAQTMYLAGNKPVAELKADGISGIDYSSGMYKKNTQLLSDAKDLGLSTNVWTVNSPLLMDYFLARNIDYITTDEPELLLEKVSKQLPEKKWKLVWADEFDRAGMPDTSKWNYDTRGNSYGWGNNEAQWYTVADPKNVAISDGTLKITARNEPTSGKQYSSARLTTKGKGDWKYCKIETRAKLCSGKGTWPAIWMLSSKGTYGGWPKSGEIDIMEFVGYDPGRVHSTVHTQKYNHVIGTQVGKALEVNDADTQFHIFTLEWDEHEIRSYMDGQLYFTFQNENTGYEAWPFDQDFHLILNLAIGGGWGGRQGIDISLFPHVFEIDYVRVFKAAGN